MKKYFYLLCASFFALTMTLTFSSCDKESIGGGLGDIPEIPMGGGGQDGNNDHLVAGKEYVEPCLQWGANNQEIHSWMKSHTQGFYSTVDQSHLMLFTCYKPYTQITYKLTNVEKPGLFIAAVSYIRCMNPLAIMEKVEKSYKCKFSADPVAENCYVAEDVIINNKKTDITALVSDIILTVEFQLDE